MIKAKLTGSFAVGELYDDYTNVESIVEFKIGMEVEVLRQVTMNSDLKLFIIYSEELNESTVVQEGLLEFLD